jgi:hypothetical protein
VLLLLVASRRASANAAHRRHASANAAYRRHAPTSSQRLPAGPSERPHVDSHNAGVARCPCVSCFTFTAHAQLNRLTQSFRAASGMRHPALSARARSPTRRESKTGRLEIKLAPYNEIRRYDSDGFRDQSSFASRPEDDVLKGGTKGWTGLMRCARILLSPTSGHFHEQHSQSDVLAISTRSKGPGRNSQKVPLFGWRGYHLPE